LTEFLHSSIYDLGFHIRVAVSSAVCVLIQNTESVSGLARKLGFVFRFFGAELILCLSCGRFPAAGLLLWGGGLDETYGL